MSWWKKMFGESTGNTKVTPVDKEEEKEPDYSDKTTSYDNKVDYSIPIVVNTDGTVSRAEEEETIVVKPKRDIKPLDLMKVTYKASPNKSARPQGQKPTHIVLHHTGPGSFNGIVNWLCNKDAKASAHYVLGTGGQLNQLVNTMKKAWHAGVSKWDGKSDVNDFSIGIEICNIGRMEKGDDGNFYYERGRKLVKYTGKAQPTEATVVYPDGSAVSGYHVPYPQKQIDKLVALCKALIEKYPEITRDNIVTHYQVAQPFGRKNDPFGLCIEEDVKDLIFG